MTVQQLAEQLLDGAFFERAFDRRQFAWNGPDVDFVDGHRTCKTLDEEVAIADGSPSEHLHQLKVTRENSAHRALLALGTEKMVFKSFPHEARPPTGTSSRHRRWRTGRSAFAGALSFTARSSLLWWLF